MTCKDDCIHYDVCKKHYNEENSALPDLFDLWLKPEICSDFKNKADFVEIKRGFWLVNRSSAEARFICSECGFMHIEADPEANIEYNGCPMCLARLDKRKEGADNG